LHFEEKSARQCAILRLSPSFGGKWADRAGWRDLRMISGQARPNDPELINFRIANGRAEINQQLVDFDALDSKIVQVFGAAGVVIGLAGVTSLDSGSGTTTILIVAVVSFIGVALAAGYALVPREFDRGTYLAELMKDDLVSCDEAKALVNGRVLESQRCNENAIEAKTWGLRFALLFTFVEILLIGLAIAAGRSGSDGDTCFVDPGVSSLAAAERLEGDYVVSLCRAS
jgi:hypothetical protein